MSALKDLAGQKFGYWTAIEYVGNSRWKCKCICGVEREVMTNQLVSETSRSCGCMRYALTTKAEDLTGQKFNKLTVISKMPHKPYERIAWLCKCDCGNERIVKSKDLKSGKVKQCYDCYNGFSYWSNYPRLGNILSNMKDRCTNPKNVQYPNYGGRGITICEEWQKIDNFVEWALANGYTDELTIDRIDVNGNYEPDNCRWVDLFVQANNTRKNRKVTYNNETHSLSEWSRITGIERSVLEYRVENWDLDRAFNEPVGKHNKRT